MIQRELYINGHRIELDNNTTRIGLTVRDANLANIATKTGSRTNEFTVPRTRKNDLYLGHCANVNSGTSIPYRYNEARYIEEGIEIIPEGFAIIKSAGKGYSIVIYTGNVNLWELMGDAKLSDLDWSDSDHQFVQSNIIAANALDTNYIYPIVEWLTQNETLQGSSIAYSPAMVPCAYIRDALNKILARGGYSASGSFIDSDIYPRLILTPDSFKNSKETIDALTGKSEVLIEQVITDHLTAGGSSHSAIHLPVFQTAGPEFFGAKYSPTEIRRGILTFAGTINFFPGASDIDIHPILRVDITDTTTGTIIASEDVYIGGSGGSMAATDFPFSVSTGEMGFTVGHDYYARIFHQTDAFAFAYNSVIKLRVGSSYSFQLIEAISYYGNITFADLFQMKQKDLVKDVCNMYSLLMSTNVLTRQVSFNFFNDVVSNIYRALDWSNKVNVKMGMDLQFQIGSYGQKNWMKYASDETVTEGYGDSYFEVDDENLPKEIAAVQLSVAATENKFRLNNIECPWIKLRPLHTSKPEKVKSRILLLDKQSVTSAISYKDGATTNNETTNIPFAYFKKTGKADNLAFDDSLIEKQYSGILGMLNKVKYITLYFNLTAADILQFDFSIPIYLSVHTPKIDVTGYFFVNEIDRYTAGKPTRVMLVRI